MTRIVHVHVAALALAAGVMGGCASAPPATSYTGSPVLDAGSLEAAPYRLEIPANWNGELVMLLHGYEPKGVPRAAPWPQNDATAVFLTEGYAVAQSAYASQGWAVADAIPDNERLRAYFSGKYGKPRKTYLVGFSLGGHIALASLEKYGAHYDGALTLCGINVPATRVFDDALASLVAFDYFYPNAAGLPSGGLSNLDSPPMDQMAMFQAIEGELKRNEAHADILSKRIEVTREGLAGVLSLHHLVLRELKDRAGGLPIDNRETRYSGFGDDIAFNNGVRRFTGNTNAMRYLVSSSQLAGRVSKPLVLRYNNSDPTVPNRYGLAYPELVKAATGTIQPVVLPAVGEGHCDFSPEQIRESFLRLVKWTSSGHPPASTWTGR